MRFRSICDEKIDVQVFDVECLTPEERAFLAITRREPLSSSLNAVSPAAAGG